ncbi:MAG: hypothetical protein HOC93_04900 [Phycisphaerae bacterium]|jgi:hypothetical protein|nr:hypothetical protein [Phycisphaerae bacterium]
MNKWIVQLGMCVLVLLSSVTYANLSVDVTAVADSAQLEIGETTTVHVYASVSEGTVGIDGLFSFCLNINFGVEGVLEIVDGSIVHPGAANLGGNMSSLGSISPSGLASSYDLFFFDQTHSIGVDTPHEVLTFSVHAIADGDFNLQVSADDADENQISDGTVTGFVLFSGEDHSGDYSGSSLEIQVGSVSPCPADLNGNDEVDIDDLLSFIGAWGPCGTPCPEDFDGNGEIGIDDLLILISAWGPC